MADEWQFAVLLGILAAGGLLLFAASRKPKDVAEPEPKARVMPKQRRAADEKFRKHRGGGKHG